MNNNQTSPSLITQVSGIIIGALGGQHITPDEQQFLDQHPIAGITLFRRNIPANYDALRPLISHLQNNAAAHGQPAMIVAIDQEGGRVRRIRAPFPDIGPNLSAFAETNGDTAISLASNYGLMSGLGLSGIGINVNFAPVVDVYREDGDDSIGDRCFDSDPARIVALAGAYIDGLHSGGVASCLKHFPGQGRGQGDTHHEGITVLASAEELAVDLRPFGELANRSPFVMVSHARYPALDPDHQASCSPTIIEGILRQKLGFDGAVLSDDVNMKAFDESPSLYDKNIIASIKAGVDGILVCEGLEKIKRTIDAIGDAIEAGDETLKARVSQSYQRIAMLRRSLT